MGGKRDREESPRGKSHVETTTIRKNKENQDASKGQRPYTATITLRAPRANFLSIGTMKWKISEMMDVFHNEGHTYVKISNRPMLGSRD